ncbi:MAG: hypothetical protein RBR22_09400 [Desulfuromonas sp.]|nr:hypothetical protein [Desulfuromonas sp.]
MRIGMLISVVLCLLLGVTSVLAGDLDDGISKFTDDNITKWDDLGKKDRNVTFIKLNARSQASVRSKNGNASGTSGISDGSANMNSVILGAGGTIRGDVIIIDDSSGDKTQIAE